MTAPALAATGTDPDWPCVQRLVPELASGQMWTGKPLDQLPADAKLAPSLQGLPEQIANRDLPLDQAAQRIDAALAQVPEAEREDQRALLFRETLAAINSARDRIIGGIKRFARNQRQLASRITAEGRRQAELRKDPAQAAASADIGNARSWDMRIYEDRQHSQRALCDQPVQLEQRAFALARIIQGQTP